MPLTVFRVVNGALRAEAVKVPETRAVAAAALALLTLINCLGVKAGSRLQAALTLTAIAMSTHAGKLSIFNAGPHGFTEAFYAYTSQTNNNGSAFAGYGALHFSTMLGAFAMLVGRFVPLLAALAIGGSVAMKKTAPASAGTMRTDGPTFVVLLTSVVILLPALTILLAIVLGPVVEALTTRLFTEPGAGYRLMRPPDDASVS